MALGEGGNWESATARIVKMIKGEDDPMEGLLPTGYGSGRVVEDFARQFEADYGVELGLSIPTLLCGISGAAQGGFTAPIMVKVKPREVIHTALVMQFIGIAEAGQQKSTLLKEVMDPLRAAVDKVAADDRRQKTLLWREKEKKKHGDKGVNVDANNPLWEKVYAGGICSSSITDQGTPEGIRNNIVRQGGHRAVLTAEPDVLREISAYANSKGGGGGSIGMLLRGWDQDDLSVDRVSNDALYVREPSLPYAILVQPESFTKYTGGTDGSDDFVDRGLFSRAWLWRAERVPVLDDFAEELLDGLDEAAAGDAALASPMNVAREKLLDRMTALAMRSNEYRISKGLEQAWRATGADLWMPRPKTVERERLAFDGIDGVRMHLKVQRMRVALRRAVQEADAVSPGIGTILDPLAQRFTTHVMRLAALLSLADDPGALVVDTAHVEDVATRIIPWLWSGWWQVLKNRLEENSRTLVAEQVLKNPKDIDLSGSVKILKAMAKLEEKAGISGAAGFTPSEIFRLARSSFQKAERSGITGHLRKTLLEIVAEGMAEVVPGSETTDVTGQVATARYRLTGAGKTELAHAG